MAVRDADILQLQHALATLTRRVQALEAAAAAGNGEDRRVPPVRPPEVARNMPAANPAPGTGEALAGAGQVESLLALLLEGVAVLDTAEDIKGHPRYFSRLARRLNLRLLLLKRWTTGLQLLHAEGLAPARGATGERAGPAQAQRIATRPDDLFGMLAQERVVYAGPTPIKHFPLDLSLLLGRVADRHLVVWPLPLRGRWNTFILIDGDGAQGEALAAVEILARYAVAQLVLMERGVQRDRGRKVQGLLAAELERRRAAPAAREAAAAPAPAAPAQTDSAAVAERQLMAPTPPAKPAAAARRPLRDDPPAIRPPGDGPVGSAAELAGILADVGGGGPSVAARDVSAAASAAEAVMREINELPALPRVANHILALIADPNTTAARLEQAIVLDQALTAKVLRIANSSFYGGLRDVNTVSEAIVRLGFITIRNWTLATAAKSVFLEGNESALLQRIWQQSVMSAMASQLVADRMRHPTPETVFVGGLMQNIGQLALARARPDAFLQILEASSEAQVPYYLVERDLLGFDHGDLGALLIREWNLSPALEEAVRRHHRLDQAGDPQASRLAAIIALGEEVAQCSGGAPDEGATLWEQSEPARLLGLGEPDYVELVEKARRLAIDPRLFA